MRTIPPTSAPGSAATNVRTRKASELGCALDVNLDTGAGLKGTATDDTALLNIFLATASASSPIVLIMDGAALITGLRIAYTGYTTIQGQGESTGFFLAQASNNDGIHNRPPNYANDPGPPVPPRHAQHVALLNFRLNGNRGDGHTGNSTQGTHGSPWLFGINLLDMEHITIDRVTVFHASTYAIRLSNVGNVTITGCRLAAFSPAELVGPTNTDGIHINGPANDITIRHCYFRTGDDGIALNAPEGHGGSIVRVSASDCVFDGSQLMMRFYAGSRSAAIVSDVTVERFSGTANVFCFIFGLEDTGPLTVPRALRNIVIRDCQVSAAALAYVQDNIRELTFDNVQWTGTGAQYGMVSTAHHALSIDTLTLKDCTVVRSAHTLGCTCVLDLLGQGSGNLPVKLARLVIDGLACSSKDFPLQALILMSAGSHINTVDVEAVNPAGIPRLVLPSQWDQITTVQGPGLLKSGWAIPDGKTAHGVAYLSHETDLASVMLDGKPHTLLHRG